MARIKKPSVKIVLRKDKVLSNGTHPICLRLTFNRKSKYYVLKSDDGTLSSIPNKWNLEIGRFNRNRELNQIIEEYEIEARKSLNSISRSEFSFSVFESKYFNSYSDTKVIGFFNNIIEKLKSENRFGTAQVYKDTRNRMTEFNKKTRFEDINLKFLKSFERFLIDKGNSANTISIYLRTLRATYNKAIAEEIFTSSDYPFQKFKIKSGNSTKRALSKADMLKLINHRLEHGDIRRQSLDYFLFSYLCRGMNLRDMAALKWKDNIIDDKIFYIRTKTANTRGQTENIIIKIEPQIEQILNRYKSNSKYVFPILENGLSQLTIRYRIHSTLKSITKDLREIAEELKIPQADKITHYWARHTFATTLKRSGISTAIISEALGHSSEATTKAYLDKFEQTEIDNTFKHLV